MLTIAHSQHPFRLYKRVLFHKIISNNITREILVMKQALNNKIKNSTANKSKKIIIFMAQVIKLTQINLNKSL